MHTIPVWFEVLEPLSQHSYSLVATNNLVTVNNNMKFSIIYYNVNKYIKNQSYVTITSLV